MKVGEHDDQTKTICSPLYQISCTYNMHQLSLYYIDQNLTCTYFTASHIKHAIFMPSSQDLMILYKMPERGPEEFKIWLFTGKDNQGMSKNDNPGFENQGKYQKQRALTPTSISWTSGRFMSLSYAV